MNSLTKTYYFAISAMMIPITMIIGLYFSSLIKGSPLLEGGFFDTLAELFQGKSDLTVVMAYIFYGITFALIATSLFLMFSIFYGKDSSDEELGLKINDRKKFKKNSDSK